MNELMVLVLSSLVQRCWDAGKVIPTLTDLIVVFVNKTKIIMMTAGSFSLPLGDSR